MMRISNCIDSDQPREKSGHKSNGAASIGVIFGHKHFDVSDKNSNTHIAVSSMHFEPGGQLSNMT